MKKQQIDISSLAEAPKIEDYQQNPIQNYGMSLLRGMGFNQATGIGRRKENQLSEIFVLKPRPKGLGLGAQLPQQKQKQKLEVGDKVLITGQQHKGLTGYINQILVGQNYNVQLFPSKSVVKISNECLKKISKVEMKKINEEIKKQDNNQTKKRKLKWIVPNIKLKIIDSKSQFYLKKVTVTDLINQKQFQCRDQSGKILTNLAESDVQTVIPKIGGIILILKGVHKGVKATLLERKKSKGILMVQTLQELQILKIQQNDAAQYVQT